MDLPTPRNVGAKLAGARDRVTSAARGLRMPGVGAAPVPILPATPLPTINPAMAAPAAPAPVAPVASMRAPATAPGLDIYGNPKPGSLPRSGVGGGQGAGFTYGSANPAAAGAAPVPPPNPNLASGMSAERAAFNAAPRGAFEPTAPVHKTGRLTPSVPSVPNPNPGTLLKGARLLGKASGVAGMGMGAYDTVSGIAEGDMKKAGVGALDTAASGSLFTPAAPIGATYMAIRAGSGILNSTLSDDAKDTIGGTINQIGQNSGLWGYDDTAAIQQRAMERLAAGDAKPLPAGMAAASPAAAASPDDIAKFNARMGKVGAGSVGMRVGETGPNSRELFNNAPASADAQRATEQNMGMRTAQLASAEAGYARAEEQRQAEQKLATLADRRFSETAQGSEFDNQLAQARSPRIGASPVGTTQQIMAQRAQAEKDFEQSKGAQMQGNVTMRGQNMDAAESRAQNAVAAQNSMRSASTAERQLAMDAQKQQFEQNKSMTEERAKAEKGLTDHLSTMFVDKDGKPDTVRVADATKKIQDELGERIKEANAVPKNSPQYATAQSIAAALSQKGLAALDPEDRQLLISQLMLRDRAKMQDGFMPGTANFVESRLSDYGVASTEDNWIGSDTLNMRNGGTIRQNDVRFTDPASPWFNGGKTQATDFDAALGMRAKGNK